ncbi:MAG: TonB-dependent receptor [Bacteroidota bacterium]|nr:TonB-dependent receptor [Bacteroidota bacterium]
MLLIRAGILHAQTEDSIKHLPPKSIEVTAPRESDLHVVDPRANEIRSATEITSVTGSTIAGDALRTLSSSLDIRRYGPLGSIAIPSFRGLPAEYTVVYRDGIQLTNEQLGLTDLGQLALHGISRVELIPSSTAVLLGGDAIGAAIDLVSQWSDTATVRIGTEQSGYQHSSGIPESDYSATVAAHPIDGLDILAGGSSAQSSGKFPFYQSTTNSYVLRENNDVVLRSADLTARYQADGGKTIQLISNYFSANRGSPGFATTPYRGAASLDERLSDEQYLTGLKFEQTGERSSSTIRGYYQHQYESFAGAIEGFHDTTRNEMLGADVTATSTFSEWLKGHTGVSYQHSRLLGSADVLTTPNVAITREKVSGYAAAIIAPVEFFRAAPSVRAEYVSDIAAFELLPQCVLEFVPLSELSTSLAYSKSFHAPTLNALYWKGLGNPALRPEHSDNVQVAASYSSETLVLHPHLSATYFYARIQDEILWQPPGTGGDAWQPFNVGVAESKGLEVAGSASYSIDSHSSVSVEERYTFLSAHNVTPGDTASGRELIYSSPRRSLLIGKVQRDDWGLLAFTATYQGHRFSDPANTSLGELPPVTTYDLVLSSREFAFGNIGFHVLLGVTNVTDVNYEEVIYYPLPGRAYKLSIELNYH